MRSLPSRRGVSMTDDLGTPLDATLGDTYKLDRELGGGGMSRVFLATQTAQAASRSIAGRLGQ